MLKVLLNTYSYFSFGAGCSSPTTLVQRAAELGYTHVALTDQLGVYGSVELIQACKQAGLKPILGATLKLEYEGAVYPLPLLAGTKRGYTILNRLITLAKETKDKETVTLTQLEHYTDDLYCLTGGRRGFVNTLLEQKKLALADKLIQSLKLAFRDRLYIQLFHDAYPWDVRRANTLRRFAREHRVSVVAAYKHC